MRDASDSDTVTTPRPQPGIEQSDTLSSQWPHSPHLRRLSSVHSSPPPAPGHCLAPASLLHWQSRPGPRVPLASDPRPGSSLLTHHSPMLRPSVVPTPRVLSHFTVTSPLATNVRGMSVRLRCIVTSETVYIDTVTSPRSPRGCDGSDEC